MISWNILSTIITSKIRADICCSPRYYVSRETASNTSGERTRYRVIARNEVTNNLLHCRGRHLACHSIDGWDACPSNEDYLGSLGSQLRVAALCGLRRAGICSGAYPVHSDFLSGAEAGITLKVLFCFSGRIVFSATAGQAGNGTQPMDLICNIPTEKGQNF